MDEEKNITVARMLAVVVVILIGVAYYVMQADKDVVCGDGKCAKSEGCSSCPSDCVCKADERCDASSDSCAKKDTPPGVRTTTRSSYVTTRPRRPTQTTTITLKPTCGNGKCEPGEHQFNCCVDCKCTIPGNVCNTETRLCGAKPMKFTDSDAISVFKQYLRDKKMSLEGEYKTTEFSLKGKSVKHVCIIRSENPLIGDCADISEDGVVVGTTGFG